MTNILITNSEKANQVAVSSSLELDLNTELPLQLAILASLKDFDLEKLKANPSVVTLINHPLSAMDAQLIPVIESLKTFKSGNYEKTLLDYDQTISQTDKLAAFSKLKELASTIKVELEVNKPVVSPVLERKSNEPSTNIPSWVAMKRDLIRAQLEELLAELEAMQQAGGEYPIAYIINVAMGIISTLSIQLEELTAKPLEHYQEISKRQAILQEKIEAIKKKALAGHSPSKEDIEGLQTAIKELDQAIDKLADAYTFEDNDGNKIIIWPNDEIRDVYEKAKKNVEVMKSEKVQGTDKSIIDADPSDPNTIGAIHRWANLANSSNPIGPFAEWEKGKDGAEGNSVMKIILETEISTFTDKLNKEAQLISIAQSMGQKQIEHANSLMRGIVGNYISR